MSRLTQRLFVFWVIAAACISARGETLRHPPTLEQQLKTVDVLLLAQDARRRGNARRGALVFYKSAAACVNCHLSGEAVSPLGPDLAKLGEVTDTYVIESLLHPSKSIRKGYETHSILTSGGDLLVGMIVAQDSESLTLRVASDLSNDKVISRDDVEAIKRGDKSMMPDGLVASLGEQRDFLDLAKYVMEVAAGGQASADSLKPSPEQLAIKDDTGNLDHAGIIKKLRSRDFDAGKSIYHGYCFNCHGNDGNTPSLPTARAFGTQKLRFGADPYRMFMTLSRGNGLMAPMSHLTPKERYQVIHYIRDQFMKPTNPEYFKVDDDYLAGLPKGTEDGTAVPDIQRDYGPALASQLEREYSSVLTIQLGELTISYDLHTLNQAGIWRQGFLDLSNTQHVRDRGEGTAIPRGEKMTRLAGWQWGHSGTLDYEKEDLLPRGPMPKHWMHYRGHYLFGDRVVLSYTIDGRSILESPLATSDTITHSLEIGPGKTLILSVADVPEDTTAGVYEFGNYGRKSTRRDASESIIVASKLDKELIGDFMAAGVAGDVDGLEWSIDNRNRLVLQIPAADRTRTIEIIRRAGKGSDQLADFGNSIQSKRNTNSVESPAKLTEGGPLLWPDKITTVGYRGLEQGGYAMDTLTLPDSTPWNTWFRTSALDFFADGRMALTTYGGDVWIVSGIDDDLTELQWKRFAGGLYEPFGVKVVDGFVYVTCKDRLTKLHDINGDGEADFYESFNADSDVSVNFHAFNFDLQTDSQGNFYYAKSGHGADTDLPGAVFKISADGRQREVYCTGFRTPNGMGILPDGRLTASDNQGQWTPASKVNLLRPGGFYGWVQTYSIPGMWEPGGGTIDLKKVVPPKTFDPPLVWMPQEFDNSSGGQLFVDDSRWGPLSGRMLHTSFGKGWMSYMMLQDVDDVTQAAIVKLPFNFRTGIMRARVNPADGQVYATGLQGWNGGARPGLLDSGVQRLRYTGDPYPMVSDCKVESDGLRISFNFPLEANSATDLDSYVAEQWNYHWRSEYGSDMYSPITDKPGIDKMNVESVTLSADAKSVKLNIPDLIPVNQVHLILKVKGSDNQPFEEEIYWTINRVPGSP
jgi:putative heme-binding domain-containing protein